MFKHNGPVDKFFKKVDRKASEALGMEDGAKIGHLWRPKAGSSESGPLPVSPANGALPSALGQSEADFLASQVVRFTPLAEARKAEEAQRLADAQQLEQARLASLESEKQRQQVEEAPMAAPAANSDNQEDPKVISKQFVQDLGKNEYISDGVVAAANRILADPGLDGRAPGCPSLRELLAAQNVETLTHLTDEIVLFGPGGGAEMVPSEGLPLAGDFPDYHVE